MDHPSEPELVTDFSLRDVLEELKAREPIFHRPELGTTRADFDGMMAADFWEIGASGRRYSREYVLAELQRRHSQEYVDQWQTSDFHCRALADKVYLLTYTLQQRERVSRRATIWRRTETGWIILFHQGTLAQSS